ncbi:DUF3320 domain-containing protein [Mycobacterium servetii]|uniref:DUF3320 domain-containing protein n=1 Tax=Mycobacterium servetii TaxID=3237418 RepID=A0ABV4C311_9MYCO
MERNELTAALGVWRESLVNLSGVNRLIKFKASKSGAVAIDSPEPDVILSGILSGAKWLFMGTEDHERDEGADGSSSRVAQLGMLAANGRAGVLHTPRPEKELGTVLRGLMRRANAELLDRGLSVLYLAFGMLHWQDVDETAMASPLLLVPVTLISRGPKTTPELAPGQDDVVVNPSLSLRMREFGIELPKIDDVAELSVTDLLAQIRNAVSAEQGWTVEPTVVLSTFSFHKEAMFRDLLENEATVLDHPVVRALATKDPSSQSGEFIFEPIEPADIDHVAPPEDTPLVLDADSSQRAAIAAAIAGRSFVMDGPPGTGKSQTIANMIGALLHSGRTVLFVSEKVAALDVVRNRLADAGLENYLLELHSHKASRKEVATALAHALDNITVAPPGMEALTRSSLLDRRIRLNDYAAAMNELREPLHLSLHYVFGVLAELNSLPSAPMPETPPADLTQAQYRAVQEIATQLERSWRPAAQGKSYLWRNVIDDSSLEIPLYRAESALEELAGTVASNSEVAAAFALTKPSDATSIVSLVNQQHENRPTDAPDSWLMADDWGAVLDARDRLALAVNDIRRTESAVSERTGVDWSALPDPMSLPAPAPLPPGPEQLTLGHASAAECSETAVRFEEVATRLAHRLDSLAAMARQLGLADVVTFDDADRILALAELVHARHRPLREWTTSNSLAGARAAVDALESSLRELADAETSATPIFTGDALHAPVAELSDRFEHRHHGLKKLSGDYRADKKALAALLVAGTKFKQGLHQLPAAVRWADAARRYEAAVAQYAGLLGPYWQGRETDFASIADALAAANRILELLRGQAVPPSLAEYVCTSEPNAAHRNLIQEIRHDLAGWKSSLAPAPALQGRPELVLEPIGRSIVWLRAQLEPLRQTAARISAIDHVTGRAHSLLEAEEILALRGAAAEAHANLRSETATYAATFGACFDGALSDLDRLNDGLKWAQETREIAGRALTDAQVAALTASRPVHRLAAAAGKWATAADRIIDAFHSDRHAELRTELDDYSNAASLIGDLKDDSTGQEEWFAYTRARADLAKHGLDTAIDFCIEQRVGAQQVPPVIEKALLRSWADYTIQNDTRIRPLQERDRSALVEEYRELDRQLILAATSDIIRAVNMRRPSVAEIGEPGVIRREGMKKSRHLPVRELISRSRNTALAIKPCFMMSPLAVSQYLPADMGFDVVIFDEASQVTPGDAINCIYRGKSLILAGDDKQLPPTSFFERVEAESDFDESDTDAADFQSVLELAKGCGAFNDLRLNWHYRSRHEDLIAFSNYKFYDGKLITYPSSHSEGPDVGVQFFHTNGVYRRGGGADNPLEATRVAERVIEHFTTRPHLTLGVVTFSVAQADAIMDAIDKARESRRDLDRFFDGDDRLNAFFVKSLESVQGDERDVIIFSIGYGPDEAGKITTNFGVLNKPKGWRRLNVAATRARQRVEVVASVRAGDIPPSTNENVEYLRAYLDYAERGQAALAIDLGGSGLGPESPFEESVTKAIRAWGYTVEPQVGAAGFRIDIGIRHPAHPGQFALGVECDGYQYHSAPAARDRDRLREQILRGLGWRLHRIWGTAWYRNRQIEEDRLRAAIEAAINAPADDRINADDGKLPRRIVETTQVETYETPSWTTEYRVADVQPLPRWIDPSEAGGHHHMTDAVVAIADIEGPVHMSLVHQRLREAWGIGRIGSKISENIDRAIGSHDNVDRDGDFIDRKGRPVDRVRTPNGVTRKVEHVAHSEIRLCATLLLRDTGTTERTELITAVARIFGWTRTGADIKSHIDGVIEQLAAGNEIAEEEGYLSLSGGPC